MDEDGKRNIAPHGRPARPGEWIRQPELARTFRAVVEGGHEAFYRGPIAREIVRAYVLAPAKAPWYIDLLNINLDNHDLGEARRRIHQYMTAFANDGTRITENVTF